MSIIENLSLPILLDCPLVPRGTVCRAASLLTTGGGGSLKLSDPPHLDPTEPGGQGTIRDGPESVARTKKDTLGKKGHQTINKNKSDIRLGSLNMRGRAYSDKTSKWKDIKTVMLVKNMTIMALQETRLDNSLTNELEIKHPKLKIYNSGESTNSKGVAFAISKEKLKYQTTFEEIVTGRLAKLILTKDDETISIYNIYMPNETDNKLTLLNQLEESLTRDSSKYKCIAGDWNFVEDDIDRSPPHEDNKHLREKIGLIRYNHKLTDGWRHHNTHDLNFTFSQENGKRLSRIDRIYVSDNMLKNTNQWAINSSLNISDHSIIMVDITKSNKPAEGKGYWRLNNDAIKYPPTQRKIIQILKQAEKDCENINNNPIEVWFQTKIHITKAIKDDTATRVRQLNLKQKATRKNLRIALKQLTYNQSNSQRRKVNEYRNELSKNELKQIKKCQDISKAKWEIYGEKYTKEFFAMNKQKPKPETLETLLDSNGRLTNRTNKMLEIAKEHHETLQKRPELTAERTKATDEILSNVKTQLNNDDIETLREYITDDEVRQAIKAAANGSAPGKDGLTYELYKELNRLDEQGQKSGNNEIPSICSLLAKVFRKMEQSYTTHPEFSTGVMSLLYKKKDKRKIENYRPITLLNTDYKIYTKILTTKIGKIAQKIIHPNQAGFVPGRSLYDHTKLTHMMISHCETSRQNGCIVALDQEKAYDKIDHYYLWETLKAFKFPEELIERIKMLYSNATKEIMINGFHTSGYKVERGLHQGDPLSCLLYDIAIEPLAEAIRTSTLIGFKIPKLTERILLTLFADDTLVYLNEKDKLEDLNKIINKFCLASTAKFNHEKTEFLPIGEKEYRTRCIETRLINGTVLDPSVTIIKETQCMRTLGAWVGNNGNVINQWNTILEKQKSLLESWSKLHLALKGKEIVLKSLIVSRAQYLATVNEMPDDVKNQMNRLMKNFLWDNKPRATMEWTLTTAPKDIGGLAMPNLQARIDAIIVMWLKRWLAPSDTKPEWAYVADEIIRFNIALEPIKIEPLSRDTWITQNWHESMSTRSTLPNTIKLMLKTARTHNIQIEGLKIHADIKLKWPAWHHIHVKNQYLWNKTSSKCLRLNHGVKSIEELVNESKGETEPPENCQNELACTQMAKKLIENIPTKYNPNNETPRLVRTKNLDHTPERLLRQSKIPITKARLFNPDVTEKGAPENIIRIFCKSISIKNRQVHQPDEKNPAYRQLTQGNEPQIEVYTDGSATDNGLESAKAGAGVWFGRDDPRNNAIKILDKYATNQKAELIAILKALEIGNGDITIYTDSMTAVKGIIENLKQWEDKGWLNVKHPEIWQRIAYLMRRRNGTITLQWVKGHNGTEGNEEADKLAAQGADNETGEELDLTVPTNFKLDGARLSALTQKNAYQLALKHYFKDPRSYNTRQRIQEVRTHVQDNFGHCPNESSIWLGLQKNIKRKVGDMIWKHIHGRLACGEYFLRIPNWGDKAYCECGQLESLNHIMNECETGSQEKIWEKAEKIWNALTEQKWVHPTEVTIMAIGAIIIGNPREVSMEPTLLYKLLVTEATWALWKERNDRIFNKENRTIGLAKALFKDAIKSKIRTEFVAIELGNISSRTVEVDKFNRRWNKLNNNIGFISKRANGSLKLKSILPK